MDAGSEDKVRALLAAALEAFARDGLAGTRVDAIARGAGMNKRLLYHYVGDKQALFDAAVALAVHRLAASPAARAGDAAAWRVLCHAAAAGRCPDLGRLASRISSVEETGQALLNCLLPALAEAIGVVNGERPPDGPKPRVKLRPSLSRAPAGSGRGG
ncbi:MAG: helix-turn-helix domain-containing protein [Pseudomonadales bacterium]|jgi:AcrR family transcriptional regulator